MRRLALLLLLLVAGQAHPQSFRVNSEKDVRPTIHLTLGGLLAKAVSNGAGTLRVQQSDGTNVLAVATDTPRVTVTALTISSLTAGILQTDGSGNVTAGTVDLGDLGNVDTSAAADGKVLKYNSISGNWEAGTDLTGGGGTAAWGNITGTLSDQTDLQNALTARVLSTRTLTAGSGLTGGGDLSADRTLAVSWGGSGTATTAARSDHTHSGVYEPALGNPAGDGYLLTSTAAGVRSWSAGSAHAAVTVSDSASVDLTLTGQALSAAVKPAGVDHGSLGGLSDDDHPLYHTDARALTWLSGRSTSDLAEGTRLYYTDARARAALSGTAPVTYNSTTGAIGITTGTTAGTVAAGNHNHSGTYEPIIASGTTSQYWRGDKTWQTLNATAVGLGDVTNTPQVQLQASTPGTTQTGHSNISGTSRVGSLIVTSGTAGASPTSVYLGSTLSPAEGGSATGFQATYLTIGSGATNLAAAYGLQIGGSSWTKGTTGTITNAYGLYVTPPTLATNNYALYVSGGTTSLGGTLMLPSLGNGLLKVTGGTVGVAVAGTDYQPAGSYVPTSRSLTAGSGLTGGGDLSADRSFAVSWGGTGSAATVARSDHYHSSLAASDGNPTGAVSVDATGNVGIGATAALGGYTPTLSLAGSEVSTSASQIELRGYRAAADQGLLGRISFHNALSTVAEKRVAQIDAYAAGDVEAGTLRFSAADTAGTLQETLRLSGSIADVFGLLRVTGSTPATASVYGAYLAPTLTPTTDGLGAGLAVVQTVGSGSTNVGDAIGLYIPASTWTKGTAGTVTRAYGLYVTPPTLATNNYALYVSGGTTSLGGTLMLPSLGNGLLKVTGGTVGVAVAGTDYQAAGSYVPTSRTLTAGSGLTGGGDLSADRSFAVSWGGTGSAATVARSDHYHSSLAASDGSPASALSVDATGNVGIGTTSPGYDLDLGGATSTTSRGLRIAAKQDGSGTANLRMGTPTRDWDLIVNAAPYLLHWDYAGTDAPLSNILTLSKSGQVTATYGLTIANLNGVLKAASGVVSGSAAASDLSGWPAAVSMTEVGYLDGVTSAIQGQINTKVTNDRQVIAGTGLTGGGILGSDVTLSVSFDGYGAANTVARSDHYHTSLNMTDLTVANTASSGDVDAIWASANVGTGIQATSTSGTGGLFSSGSGTAISGNSTSGDHIYLGAGKLVLSNAGNLTVNPGTIKAVGGYLSSDGTTGGTDTVTYKDGSGVNQTMIFKNGLFISATGS